MSADHWRTRPMPPNARQIGERLRNYGEATRTADLVEQLGCDIAAG
jgi:hypothetical protein